MSVDAKTVMELRRMTGAGMMDCKKALIDADGDIEKAKDILRAKGLKDAAKKSGRAAKEGVIGSYVHHNSKMAAMVELLCETDFVAMNDRFQELARNLAMHVAATSPSPEYLRVEDVPADIIARETAIYREQVADKPAQIQDKIIEGKLQAFYKERVLLEQPYAMDASMGSVNDVLSWAKSKAGFGENTVIRRFVRWAITDDIPTPGGDGSNTED